MMFRLENVNKKIARSRSGQYLPEGVIYNILSHTKVTSLLRFKSVSSLWQSIISKPTFKDSHHPNSLKYPSLLMITSKPAIVIKEAEQEAEQDAEQVITHPSEEEEEEEKVKVEVQCCLGATFVYSDSRVSLPLPSVFNTMFFISSCNGIVCVGDGIGEDVYLFNPLTRLSKKLPPVVPVPVLNNNYYNRQQQKAFKVDLVFGFDCVSDDFKVLKIQYRQRYRSGQLVSVHVVELYSSNADSWKEIQVNVKLPDFVNYPFCPVLISGPVLDGVLYLEGMNEIVTFDLHSELFGLISFPSFMKTRKSNVLDFEGSIAVVVESVGDGLVDKEMCLWSMDTISGEVFWNKMFKFDAGLEINWVFLYLGAKQFVIRTKLGEMLYDNNNKETKRIELPSQNSLTKFLKHAESFISIKGFKQVEENFM